MSLKQICERCSRTAADGRWIVVFGRRLCRACAHQMAGWTSPETRSISPGDTKPVADDGRLAKTAAVNAQVASVSQAVTAAASATDEAGNSPVDPSALQDASVEPRTPDVFNDEETIGDSEVDDSALLPAEAAKGASIRLLNTVLLTISAIMLLAIGVLIGIYLSPPPKSGGGASGEASKGTPAGKSVVLPASGLSLRQTGRAALAGEASIAARPRRAVGMAPATVMVKNKRTVSATANQERIVSPLRPLKLQEAAAGNIKAPVAAVTSPVEAATAPAAGETPSAGSRELLRIKKAIARGVDYLLGQEVNGNWEPDLNGRRSIMLGGESALVLESLLQVEQSLHLPQVYIFTAKMRAAISYVAKLRTPTTYVASFQANDMNLLPAKKQYHDALLWDMRYLLGAETSGAYSYQNPKTQDFGGGFSRWDNSNSQYGVLGTWACADSGLEIPAFYWHAVAYHWHRTQLSSGAWVYTQGGGFGRRGGFMGNPRTMTPAGLASLFIADSYTSSSFALKTRPDKSLLEGLSWVNRHFSPNNENLYEMYGDERVALASGLKYFGGVDWYRAMAHILLHAQHRDGSWSPGFALADRDRLIGTAYALLILARGMNPILINKLQYTPQQYGPWNNRPWDAANFTAWVSRTYETAMNWQVVSVDAPAKQWTDAPLLLITGGQDPHFTAGYLIKLEEYIDAGGMIFSSSDADSPAFTRAMERYAVEIGQGRYQVRKLAPTSVIYSMQPWYHLRSPPFLLGVWNGVRYVWIISPQDFGAIWQRRSTSASDYWQIPTNIYLYATGKSGLQNRMWVSSDAKVSAPAVRHVRVAQLQYAGNWNPEPGAWPHLADLARRRIATRVSLNADSCGQLLQQQPTLVTLTGTGSFEFTSNETSKIRRYLLGGGMLFADAAGGRGSFARSFEHLVEGLFPKESLTEVPETSTLITGALPGGESLEKAVYRKYLISRGESHKHVKLLGIKADGRWIVVFSAYDVTSGLLGTNTWGIAGYAPPTAQGIAQNILLYSAAHASHGPRAN
ncbi:MAG: DUF4159 domain-containing protein [Phycisphaerales bacterium]|nr:DUF4159 domain-containing protein [Phycisphaerales bacterium]